MGHRALIAYRRSDELFNLHYSHWGAHGLELCDRITAETPLGGPEGDVSPGYLGAFTAMLDEATDDDTGVEGRVAEGAADRRTVDPQPRVTGASMLDVMSELDEAWYEALYVVDIDADPDAAYDPQTGQTAPSVAPDAVDLAVTGYHVETDLRGEYLLIHPRWYGSTSDHTNLEGERGRIDGLKTALGEMVEDDILSEREANGRFMNHVLDWYGDSTGRKHVLAWSPAVAPEHLERTPTAFLQPTGLTNVMGEMYPTSFREMPGWAIPPDFPGVKTADGERVDLTG